MIIEDSTKLIVGEIYQIDRLKEDKTVDQSIIGMYEGNYEMINVITFRVISSSNPFYKPKNTYSIIPFPHNLEGRRITKL